MSNRNDRGRAHREGMMRWGQRRSYNPDEDMGGSHWSGASGRGGMSWTGPNRPDREHSGQGFTVSDFGPEPERYRSPGIVRDYDQEEGERDFGGPEFGPSPTPERARGPHYGKGPKGYKRSDERILEDVCEAIASQGTIDASDVEVRVESGVVILTGTVAERRHKRALEQLAERPRGVEDVHNELRLRRPRVPSREPSPTSRDAKH
jgi:hypothetical protein